MLSISSTYFLNQAQVLDTMGFPFDDSYAAANASSHDLRNPKYRVHYDDFNNVLNEASRKLEIANIGLELAYKFRLLSIGDMGSLLAYCNDLEHVAKFNRRYSKLAETIGEQSFENGEQGAFQTWTPKFTDDEKYLHITEFILGGYIVTINWMSWSFDNGVKSVSFKHSPPDDLSRHSTICRCDISFNQPENRLELYPENVHKPLPSANPEKLKPIEDELKRVLKSVSHNSPLENKSFSAIRRAILSDTLSITTVAQALNMSERTFRRQLRTKNTSYRQIVETVRRTMCRTYMDKGTSFTEIAQLLGYNDQSAFTRAFKKWYGVSPRDYHKVEIAF